MNRFIQAFGLHPLSALGMICVDIMLFGADATGVGWLVSCSVAVALTIPCILIQRYSYNDNWGTAVGKGMIIGILTAIPSPLPAIITGAGGVLGTVGAVKGLLKGANDSETIK